MTSARMFPLDIVTWPRRTARLTLRTATTADTEAPGHSAASTA
jgi:hypothetical protein